MISLILVNNIHGFIHMNFSLDFSSVSHLDRTATETSATHSVLKNEDLMTDLHKPFTDHIILPLSYFSLGLNFLAQISILAFESLALVVALLTSMLGARNSLGHHGVRIASPSCKAFFLFFTINFLGDPNFFVGLPSFSIKRFVATHGRSVASHATHNVCLN